MARKPVVRKVRDAAVASVGGLAVMALVAVSACMAEPQPGAREAAGPSESGVLDTGSWDARVTAQPGQVPTLTVSGEVTMPNPGYRASLQREDAGGPESDALSLRLTADPPDPGKFWAQVLVTRTVRYQEPLQRPESVARVRILSGSRVVAEVPVARSGP